MFPITRVPSWCCFFEPQPVVFLVAFVQFKWVTQLAMDLGVPSPFFPETLLLGNH